MTPFEAAIAALGTTSEEVSAKLRAMGIKGYRMSAGRCPIANYLKACGFPVVSVCNHASRYADSEAQNSDETIYLHEGVWQWVVDFDARRHPEFHQD